MVRMLGGIGRAGGGRGCRGAREPDRTHQSLRQVVMIGDARAIGSHRKNRYLAQYDKQDLTIDMPYGARRVKRQVDATEIEISIIDPFAALSRVRLWVSLTIRSDARPVFSMHVGIALTDGLQTYVFRAELDALV